MRTVRVFVVNTILPAFLFGGTFFIVGCGGGDTGPTVVKPDVPPTTAAKDSMDFFKSQMKNKAGKANKKK